MYIHPKLWTEGFPFPPSLTFLTRFILSLLSQFLFLPFFSILILTSCLWEGSSTPCAIPVEHYKLFPHAVWCWTALSSECVHLVQASCSVSSCSVCFTCSTHYKMHTAAGLFSCQRVRSSMHWMLKHEAKQLNSFVCFGTLSLCVVFQICSQLFTSHLSSQSTGQCAIQLVAMNFWSQLPVRS